MGMVDEAQSPPGVDYTLPDNLRSPSMPSKTSMTTQISDPVAGGVGLKLAESLTPKNECSSVDDEVASPGDEVGQTYLAHSDSTTIPYEHVENASQQTLASENGGSSAPPTKETRRASIVISPNTFSKEDQEDIREDIVQGVDHRGLESVDHVANGPVNGEEGPRERPPAMAPSRTPLSSLALQRVEARRPQRPETQPGDIRPRPENEKEQVAGPSQTSQAGPALNRSSPEPLSRKNSSATSTKSAEWDPVLDIGFNDKNGKKQWRILSLDTNSDVNIVAQIVVDELGLADQIEKYNGRDLKGLGSDTYVKPVGQIELTFSVVHGRKTLKKTFLVLNSKDAEEFDAIVGLPLLMEEKWIRRGKPCAFMVLSR
jgi:hypothetical protein